jgi:alanine dehydrogenase
LASLDAANVMRLAEELAMRVDNAHVVLARNGISTAEWAVLKSSPAFRTYLKEAIERWQSPAMSEARIAAKAVHLVEVADGVVAGGTGEAALPAPTE